MIQADMKKRVLKPKLRPTQKIEVSESLTDKTIMYENNLAMPVTITERGSSSSANIQKSFPPANRSSPMRGVQNELRFGTMYLTEFPEGRNRKFKPFEGLNIDREQQCLLDNIWHIQTEQTATQFKVQCLNALSMYFSEKNPKKQTYKKPFTHYVIFRGLKTGVFNSFNTVKNYVMCQNPIFIGYHSFAEALEEARAQLGPNFYIEPETVRPYSEVAREDPSQLIARLENRNRELEEQIIQLQKQTEKQIAFLEQKKNEAERKSQHNHTTASLLNRLDQLIKEQKQPKTRSFVQLRARLLDMPAHATLKPLFDEWPEAEEILKQKTEERHLEDLMNAQKDLVSIHFEEAGWKFKGVKIIQKPFYITSLTNKKPGTAGLFKLQIDLNLTDMPFQKILSFFHMGMIDQLTFSLDEEGQIERYLEEFGEKFFLIAGNMAMRKKLICFIDSTLPWAIGFGIIPAKKRVFILSADASFRDREILEDDNMIALDPYDFQQLENTEIYRAAQIPKILATPKNWMTYHLLGEGYFIQIYSTSEWKMFLPHSGDGRYLYEDHIVNTEDSQDREMTEAQDSDDELTIPDSHRDL